MWTKGQALFYGRRSNVGALVAPRYSSSPSPRIPISAARMQAQRLEAFGQLEQGGVGFTCFMDDSASDVWCQTYRLRLLPGKRDKDLSLETAEELSGGWRLNHFPGQPVPMLDNPFSEEKFPNIPSKPPLVQLEAISSCPITSYLGEETDPHLSTTSFQAKQSQLPQPLLIRLLLQTLHQLLYPSLHTLQHLNIPLVVGGPKLNTVFEVRPHQCQVQGHNHFTSPAGHAIFDTSQDAIGFLGRLGTLLAHIQAAVNQHPQVLFCLAAFQPLFPKPVALHGVAAAQVQDLALGLVKLHTIHPSPSIQPVQVPLQILPTLQQINTPTQLGVVCKLTEGALDPFVQIIDKDVKQNWPQHRALGNTACDRPLHRPPMPLQRFFRQLRQMPFLKRLESLGDGGICKPVEEKGSAKHL
ncbi:hypothetical protein QYF61_022162 [Mycteria americana]|uniref:Uncharacterized protein n=1 Tax=Mycteria americana TaxID=33587 RepID=A0AAN7RPW6_MYCAM|nr:hypothetical protein QYF61_022162 [Mycteria americana]